MLKKHVCVLLFNCSEKLQNVFEIGLKKCEVIVQKSLSEKKYFKRKKIIDRFLLVTVPLKSKLPVSSRFSRDESRVSRDATVNEESRKQ